MLRADHPRICNRLPVELRERYLDREGYFSDARSSEAPRRMELAALDPFAIFSLFKGLRKLRVRGKQRVSLAVRLEALALDFKRFANHVADTLAVPQPSGHPCAC